MRLREAAYWAHRVSHRIQKLLFGGGGASEIRNVSLLLSKVWLRETRAMIYNSSLRAIQSSGSKGQKIRGEVAWQGGGSGERSLRTSHGSLGPPNAHLLQKSKSSPGARKSLGS